MSRPRWTAADMPDLRGKRALVTGATGGLGEQTALELARSGAQVVVTGRSPEKLQRAAAGIRRSLPGGGDVLPVLLDLADLGAVRRAAKRVAADGPLHLLINNAGVMAAPYRRTVDGFELQLATNHLGHFALTGLLLPSLVAAPQARVVTVSSSLHRRARTVPLGDLCRGRDGRGYDRWQAYAESKLANLLFAFELDRRARAGRLPLASLAAHPGYAATGLVRGGLRMENTGPGNWALEAVTRLVGQSAAAGALPTLMAATHPRLPGGSFVGPGGPRELRGSPTVVPASATARDKGLAALLWAASEDATGVQYLSG